MNYFLHSLAQWNPSCKMTINSNKTFFWGKGSVDMEIWRGSSRRSGPKRLVVSRQGLHYLNRLFLSTNWFKLFIIKLSHCTQLKSLLMSANCNFPWSNCLTGLLKMDQCFGGANLQLTKWSAGTKEYCNTKMLCHHRLWGIKLLSSSQVPLY